MSQNLFAACLNSKKSLVARRIPLDDNVQNQIQCLFDSQETDFRRGIEKQVEFDGRWKPGDDELLTIEIPSEASIFTEAIANNASSTPSIDTKNFIDENIKAIFTGSRANGGIKALVQSFTSRQLLERKFSLLCKNNTFRRLVEPTFSFENSLTCIIEEDKIKFKSQQKLRHIIDLSHIYRAATDNEVKTFATHESLDVMDVANFMDSADQVTRKLIHVVNKNEILDNHKPDKIVEAAKKTYLTLEVRNNKIVIPSEKAKIKALLQFLNESRYLGPLSGKPYLSNSQRPVPSDLV